MFLKFVPVMSGSCIDKVGLDEKLVFGDEDGGLFSRIAIKHAFRLFAVA